MRDHPVIEQIERTGYPYNFLEEEYECEVCGKELLDGCGICCNCQEDDE